MATYGANVLTGGTASAKTDRGGTTYAAAKAVDGNAGTRWASNDGDVPSWWQYDLGVGVTKKVEKVGFYLASTERTKDFEIEASNDGSTWTILYRDTGTNDTSWHYYAFVNDVAFRYYRITVFNVYSGIVGSITEIEMYECTDTTGLTDWRLCTQGTVTSSTDRLGYLKTMADDGILSTRWATPDSVTSGWWKMDLGVGVSRVVTELDFITQSTEIPHAFTFEGSNNDSSWTPLLSANGANVQTWQTFAVTNTAGFRYYRMSISTVWAGSVVSISEIRLLEARGATPTPPAGLGFFMAVVVM